MINSLKFKNYAYWGCSAGSLIFFSAVLSHPSIYKIGFVILLLTTIFFIKKIDFKSLDATEKSIIFYFLFLAFFWGNSFDSIIDYGSGGDDILRYMLASLCFLGVARFGFKASWMFLGISLGCISTAALAIYQVGFLERANGFTNAIRFGNLALLLGLFAAVIWILTAKKNKLLFFLSSLAFAGGVIASFLSHSRGGWLLFFVLPVLLFLFEDSKKYRKITILGFFCFLAIFSVAVKNIDFLNKRFESAVEEVAGYQTDPEEYAKTSVGARLEMWKLAVKLGSEKPLLGWGEKGAEKARKEYIASGHASPAIERYSHAHNQYLEMWVRKGMVGVFGLSFIYLFPFFIFNKWRKNLHKIDEAQRGSFNAVAWCGIIFCFSHFVFGWTDYFINMSLGHNFFAATLVLFFGYCSFIARNYSKKSC